MTTIDQVVDSGVISDLRVPVGEAKVDAIVVVGAEPKADGLDGMARLVTEDVYDNLKVIRASNCFNYY